MNNYLLARSFIALKIRNRSIVAVHDHKTQQANEHFIINDGWEDNDLSVPIPENEMLLLTGESFDCYPFNVIYLEVIHTPTGTRGWVPKKALEILT